MNNIMNIDGFKAIITYDNEIEMFRGEFINLNGGADFYANDVKELRKEGQKSLQTYLDVCKEKGINPKKEYSGKLPLRISPELHSQLVEASLRQGISINQIVQNSLKETLI
ncbi:HicB family (HicB) [Commensalibacter communis]|uniref:type II toxin-antitoxin system HicB family antitoxin n=1 Tax=Commensalibacter communis TaxID=2972786 RepID=UPI0022FF72A2|nr:type II toxin-antitoxin system HicB family antitoxin [Commensalibacter communis]CAI3959221.1 HicB family (HicB) [Commensalibacter communis]